MRRRRKQAVEIAVDLLECRETLRRLHGSAYDAKMGMWRQLVRAVMAKHSCAVLQVPLKLEPKPSGFAMVALLAAVCDVTDEEAKR